MNRNSTATILIALAVLLPMCAAHAALIPYDQTFESGSPTDSVIGMVSASTNAWSIVGPSGGNHLYENTLTGSGAKGFTSIQFPALGPASTANGFEMSVVFNPAAITSSSYNYTGGLRFLAAGDNSVNNSYVADLNIGQSAGRMRVVEWTGSSAVVYPSSTQGDQPLMPNFSVTKSYLLDVKGTYDATNTLTVVFTVTDIAQPVNKQTYTYVDSTPRTGQYFGLYDSIGSGGTTMTVDYDDLTVVPEPATMSLLIFGGIAALIRRRK